MQIIQAGQVMSSDPAHLRLAHDTRYAHGSAFVKGRYCSLDDATVPLTDTGFTQADAAYDVVSASKGFLFRLDDHLERFQQSCEAFRLRNPHDKAKTTEILVNLLRLAGTREAYVWFGVTRGRLPAGASRIDPLAWENAFLAYVVPYVFISDDARRTRGLDVMVSRKYIRIPPAAVDPKAKNFHWMDLKLALFEANDHGKDWSVLCDADGYLTEAPGSNIFFVKDGALWTPDTGCLEGITRKTTLELGAEIGMPLRVEPVHMSQLLEADEAFITSTAGGVMPINSVDGRLLGGIKGPGEFTTRLHNLYWEKRWSGWLGTPVDYTVPVDTGL